MTVETRTYVLSNHQSNFLNPWPPQPSLILLKFGRFHKWGQYTQKSATRYPQILHGSAGDVHSDV